ncbi:unnamed protein product [Chrysoparadoxa australica]
MSKGWRPRSSKRRTNEVVPFDAATMGCCSCKAVAGTMQKHCGKSSSSPQITPRHVIPLDEVASAQSPGGVELLLCPSLSPSKPSPCPSS